MTQLSAHAPQVPHPEPVPFDHPALAESNTHLGEQAWSTSRLGFLVLAAAGLVGTVIAAIVNPRHALAAVHMGGILAASLSIGAMFFVMFFYLTQAGWSATLRRQFENVMSVMPVGLGVILIVALIELTFGVGLVSWLNPEITAEGHLIEHKSPYLNVTFVLLRLGFYIAFLLFLSNLLLRLSLEQDRTGDKRLTLRARFHSSWGTLAAGFVASFLAMDWLMSLADYRFFSTMWGVYFFAGGVFGMLALVVLILVGIRASGKLEGLVTEEHFHDMGKFLFGFSVFWGYIAYGQYFLIWYSNIPEETAFFVFRQEHWPALTAALAIGHFILPFFILLWRRVRRTPALLASVAVFLLVMHVLDVYWIVRPVVDTGPGAEPGRALAGAWIDAAGIALVLGVFATVLITRIAARPLTALRDPRLPEALRHKNYV